MQEGVIAYRQAGPEDLAACVALMVEMVDELDPGEGQAALKAKLPTDFAAALANEDVVVVLAEAPDGTRIGLARGDTLRAEPTFRLQPDPRCGYVDQMFVQPPYRQRQVGQALLMAVEAWFKQRGLAAVLLHAAPKALTFYERLGYLPNREMYKHL